MRKLIAKFAKFIKRGRLTAIGAVVAASVLATGVVAVTQTQPVRAASISDGGSNTTIACGPITTSVSGQTNTAITYAFTVTGSGINTSKYNYLLMYTYGPNNQYMTSPSSSTSVATIRETISKSNTARTVTIWISAQDKSDSAHYNDCSTTVTVPAVTVVTPNNTLACKSLAYTVSNKTFTATITPAGTKITGYIFNFGDGTSKTQSSNAVLHSYTKNGTYIASFTAISTTGATRMTDACKTTVVISSFTTTITTTPTGPTTTPVTTTTTPTTTAAAKRQAELPRTGAGNIFGIATITTILGSVMYQLAIRRRLTA